MNTTELMLAVIGLHETIEEAHSRDTADCYCLLKPSMDEGTILPMTLADGDRHHPKRRLHHILTPAHC